MEQLLTKSGEPIPKVGLGTFPLKGEHLKNVVTHAVQVGYRLFDTSDDYQNEDAIGSAIVSIIENKVCRREDLFLQTKISDCDSYLADHRQNAYFGRFSSLMKEYSVRDIVRSKVFNSLDELCTDYLDSVLLHFPYPQYYEDMWRALIELQEEGLIRYIGVSNFNVRELVQVSKLAVPSINEIYLSPFGTKGDVVKYCNENDIQLMTYSPLAVARGDMFYHPIIKELMEKYNITRSQVILCWNIQVESIPIPKSSNKVRLQENFNSINYKFTDEEIELLNALNIYHQYPPLSKDCPGI